MSATTETPDLVDVKNGLMEPKDSSNRDMEHLDLHVETEASGSLFRAGQAALEADSPIKDQELAVPDENGEQAQGLTGENVKLLSSETCSNVDESNGEACTSELQVVAGEQVLTEVSPGGIHDVGDSRQESLEINKVQKSPSDSDIASRIIQKDDENRVLTMRELLDDLKDNDRGETAEIVPASTNHFESERGESRSLESQEGIIHQQEQHVSRSDAAMELINSITGVDDEGRSRQRILTFAAKRYASAIERNAEDYDAFYNWALVLQESADNVGADSSSSKDGLLDEACKKYEEATRICPTLHDAFYNWAIAISDRAKIRGRTKDAEDLWKQATRNYEKAVQLSWNSPQALNNWGLALQELSAIVPAREKLTIVKTAISKFRSAIQLQFEFHRAIYNLGTVLYGLAEDTLRTVGSGSVKDVSRNELYSQSAVYIAAAHALKPNYSVYHSALKLVRSMLPLPNLKVGYLNAPPVDKPVAPHTDWRLSQFVLNHEGLQQINKVEQCQLEKSQSSRSTNTSSIGKGAIKIDVQDIISAASCADLTLPPGAGLCIDTIRGPIFLVAESWELLDGWLDAIRLVYTIYARGKSDVLAGVLIG